MKNIQRILLASLVLFGLQVVLVGCLVGVSDRGRGGPWFHDGPWMDGGHGGGMHGDIHPPGYRR
jgi:hypothetical protein